MRWADLSASEQAQVRSLRIATEQVEFAGTIERAIDKLAAGQGDDLVGLAIGHGAEIVGFVLIARRSKAPGWAEPEAATLSAMRIGEQYQGRGFGAAALQALADWVRQHWPQAHALSLSVDEGNAAGVRAYRKAGFVDHGERVAGRIGWVRTLSRPIGSER